VAVNYCGDFKVTYKQTNRILNTPFIRFWTVLLLVGLGLFPFIVNPYFLSLSIFVIISIIGALGLNLLTGLTGQISIGHAAFMAIGGYTSGILSSRLGIPFIFCFLAAGFSASLLGLVVGIPSVRLKGFYLAISTLAFQFIVEFAILIARPLTGGPDGLMCPPVSFLGYAITGGFTFYFLCLVVALLSTAFMLNVRRTKYGRVFMAIRDRDQCFQV